jgi:hypothetical protein
MNDQFDKLTELIDSLRKSIGQPAVDATQFLPEGL